jgi:2-aminoethylphosphonate transport system permease protein
MATDLTLSMTQSKPYSLRRIGAWAFTGFAALLCFWLFVLPVLVVAA